MPLLGLAIGRSLAHHLGTIGTPVAGGLLGLAGAYVIVWGLFAERTEAKKPELNDRRLILIGGVLSIDNLVIGFALGAYGVNLVIAAVTIAGTSVGLSLLGLEIGERLGTRLGRWSELVGGGVLIVVGIGIGIGLH